MARKFEFGEIQLEGLEGALPDQALHARHLLGVFLSNGEVGAILNRLQQQSFGYLLLVASEAAAKTESLKSEVRICVRVAST